MDTVERQFEARKHVVKSFSAVSSAVGAIAAIGDRSFSINSQGGQIEVFKVRYDGGEKMSGTEFCAENGLKVGALVGT